jgi:hypothetical protein
LLATEGTMGTDMTDQLVAGARGARWGPWRRLRPCSTAGGRPREPPIRDRRGAGHPARATGTGCPMVMRLLERAGARRQS